MKKIIIMAVVGLFAGIVLAQTNDYSNRSVRDPVQLEAKLNADFSAIDTRIDAVTVQTDTNATTTATRYLPVAIGQLLVGSTGTGTGSLWFAKGLTTNDWVKVHP